VELVEQKGGTRRAATSSAASSGAMEGQEMPSHVELFGEPPPGARACFVAARQNPPTTSGWGATFSVGQFFANSVQYIQAKV